MDEEQESCNLVLIYNGNEEIIQIPDQYRGEYYSFPSLLGWSEDYVLLTLYNDNNEEQPALVYDIKIKNLKHMRENTENIW